MVVKICVCFAVYTCPLLFLLWLFFLIVRPLSKLRETALRYVSIFSPTENSFSLYVWSFLQCRHFKAIKSINLHGFWWCFFVSYWSDNFDTSQRTWLSFCVLVWGLAMLCLWDKQKQLAALSPCLNKSTLRNLYHLSRKNVCVWFSFRENLDK